MLVGGIAHAACYRAVAGRSLHSDYAQAMRSHFVAALVLVAACGSPAPDPASDSAVAAAPATSPATAAAVLPATIPQRMKGLSMYGFVKDGKTYFTLITGTNRLKSFEELDDAEPLVGDDGWVRVRVEGVDAARDLLGRVSSPDEVIIQSVHHVSVAQSTVPERVSAPDDAVLAAVR